MMYRKGAISLCLITALAAAPTQQFEEAHKYLTDVEYWFIRTQTDKHGMLQLAEASAMKEDGSVDVTAHVIPEVEQVLLYAWNGIPEGTEGFQTRTFPMGVAREITQRRQDQDSGLVVVSRVYTATIPSSFNVGTTYFVVEAIGPGGRETDFDVSEHMRRELR